MILFHFFFVMFMHLLAAHSPSTKVRWILGSKLRLMAGGEGRVRRKEGNWGTQFYLLMIKFRGDYYWSVGIYLAKKSPFYSRANRSLLLCWLSFDLDKEGPLKFHTRWAGLLIPHLMFLSKVSCVVFVSVTVLRLPLSCRYQIRIDSLISDFCIWHQAAGEGPYSCTAGAGTLLHGVILGSTFLPCHICSPLCPQHIIWHAGLACQKAPADSQNSREAALKYEWCWCSQTWGWCLSIASVHECWLWAHDGCAAKPSALGLHVHGAE